MRSTEQLIAIIESDHDQDRERCKKWIREGLDKGDPLTVWLAIQNEPSLFLKTQDIDVVDVVLRFAEIGFSEMFLAMKDEILEADKERKRLP